MKRILLASTAAVALAGAAHADGHTGISFGGDAELGWNGAVDNGVFWSLGLSVSGSAELDNGLTATISGDVEFVSDADQATPVANSTFDGNDIEIDDLVIGLASDTASLKFGDTAPAADAIYKSPVTNVDGDGFNDEGDAGAALDEDGVLIGRATFGETEVGMSYWVFATNDAPGNDDLKGLQIGASTTVGSANLVFGYQEAADFDGDGTDDISQIVALGASTTLGGAEVGFAYASTDGGTDSIGVQAAYSFGDVTATVFYVSQDPVDDNYGIAVDYASGPVTVGFYYHDGNDEETAINVTYDVGNGLTLFGGWLDEGEDSAGDSGSSYFYVGGDYDLGGGASLRVSYADVSEGDVNGLTNDELGAAEDVKEGTTVAVSFAF